jgi:hypothetical protein
MPSPSDLTVEEYDLVKRPAHYNRGGIECIDAIRAQLSDMEWQGYLRGQIAKYNWRLGAKDDVTQEAGKLLFYSRLLAGEDPRS